MCHNVCCVLIEIHYMDFDQLQTRHYEQRNKRSRETISIVGNEREENRKGISKQIAELFTNNEIIT